MQAIDVSKRTIGINFTEDGMAVVNVWSPMANKVTLITNGEEIELAKQDHGYWHAVTDKLKEGFTYKIKIDDKIPFPDPASLSQPNDVHGESELIDLNSFQWSANQWNNLPLEDFIIYELHTGTFTEEGTFFSVIQKLDYLKELGINAIELMPVAQFPGNRNWGYDGVFPFAVQNSYGGAKGLQQLVDACHQKGIAVILDVVHNHLGPEGNYLAEFGPYFTNKYNIPWGNAINFDDAWCDGVRRYFMENVLMWFRDFRIDALRLDAVHAIKDFSPVHILKEIRLCVDNLMEMTGRKHYLVVESDLNDTRFIDPVEKGGYGMDAQWIDEFHHALRVTAGQEGSGYYSDFSGIADLAKSYKDAYVYDGQYSHHRKRFFGVKAEAATGKQFVVFSQNHDHVGNRMLGERTSSLASFEMRKLMAGAVLVSPFLPLLFMGEEWSETNPFQYFISHTDVKLVEAVRKGRKEEFKAFHAVGEAPDPVAEETFQRSKLQWHLVNSGEHKTMLAFYKKLIALRKENEVMKHLNRKAVNVNYSEKDNTLFLHRTHGQDEVLCLMNFSKEKKLIQKVKANEWQIVIDSAEKQWGGPGAASVENNAVFIQPEAIVILSNRNS